MKLHWLIGMESRAQEMAARGEQVRSDDNPDSLSVSALRPIGYKPLLCLNGISILGS